MLVQVKLSCSVTPTSKVMKPKLKDLAQFAEEFSDRTISQHFGGHQTSSCFSVSLMWHLASPSLDSPLVRRAASSS